MKNLLLATVLLFFTAVPLQAATIRSEAGAKASVSDRYAHLFQAYIRALEAHGAKILFMGGVRKGTCAPPRHKHPCGMALDVCQRRRGVVDSRCHLPDHQTIIQIARHVGLVEGAEWRHSDYGHAEVPSAYQLAHN